MQVITSEIVLATENAYVTIMMSIFFIWTDGYQ